MHALKVASTRMTASFGRRSLWTALVASLLAVGMLVSPARAIDADNDLPAFDIRLSGAQARQNAVNAVTGE